MDKFLLLIVSIVGYALWSFFQKIALQKSTPIQAQIIGCMVAIICLPVYFLMAQRSEYQFNWSGAKWTIIASICGAFAGVAYLSNLKVSNLGIVSVLTCTYPILSVILSVIFLGEQITIAKIIGTILVVIGIISLSY